MAARIPISEEFVMRAKRIRHLSLGLCSATAMAMLGTGGITPANAQSDKIIHDAEFYVLQAQHEKTWAEQDKEIDAKLAELEKKFGRKPNIIHIMWDDTAVGEVGIPVIQSVRGFKTPNMNQMASEGINFMRMYTEPSCTPSRAAVLTGRHAIRSGMHTVAFPVEYCGIVCD
jgi:hypothetical protein